LNLADFDTSYLYQRSSAVHLSSALSALPAVADRISENSFRCKEFL